MIVLLVEPDAAERTGRLPASCSMGSASTPAGHSPTLWPAIQWVACRSGRCSRFRPIRLPASWTGSSVLPPPARSATSGSALLLPPARSTEFHCRPVDPVLDTAACSCKGSRCILLDRSRPCRPVRSSHLPCDARRTHEPERPASRNLHERIPIVHVRTRPSRPAPPHVSSPCRSLRLSRRSRASRHRSRLSATARPRRCLPRR